MLDNILSIRERIKTAALRAKRDPGDITLVAVTKKQPLSKIQEYCSCLAAESLKPVIGENYVQEFRDKRSELPENIEAHLIGPLQSNKVKLAVSLFDVIESVDSLKVAKLIDKEARKIGKIQEVLLQVNVSSDPAKSGFGIGDLSEELFGEIKQLSNLKIAGLMTITQFYDDAEQARADFRRLKTISEQIRQSLNLQECSLSMGMSDDFEVAIEEGASHVRIGTALFGDRIF